MCPFIIRCLSVQAYIYIYICIYINIYIYICIYIYILIITIIVGFKPRGQISKVHSVRNFDCLVSFGTWVREGV